MSLEKIETTRGEKNQEKWQLIFTAEELCQLFVNFLGEVEKRLSQLELTNLIQVKVVLSWKGTGSNEAGSDGADGRMEWRAVVLTVQLYRRVERKWKFRTPCLISSVIHIFQELWDMSSEEEALLHTYLVFAVISLVHLGRIDGYRAPVSTELIESLSERRSSQS